MHFKIQVVLYLVHIRFQKWVYKNNLHALQRRKWKKFQSVLLSTPFYKEKALINTPLSEYPLMNKLLFMENFDTINTHNILLHDALEVATKAEESRDFSAMIKDVTVGLSSGTSGNRGVFLATEKERALWVATIIDRVIGLSFKKRTVAFFLRANSNLYDSVKSRMLRFEFFDIFNTMSTHIERLNTLQPNILVAQPSLLLELAALFSNGTLSINPQKIISVAEVLYPEDRNIIETIFKQRVHQVYQCTEGFLASTCKEGNLHFNEDFLIIEKKYLDNSTSSFHPVITDLMRHSQPIVRYELNDIIHEKKYCACGQRSLAIEQIEGRSDDVLRFETEALDRINIYPDFFRRAIILADSSIQDYIVVQQSAKIIELYVGGTLLSYEKAEKGIEALLHSFKINNVAIIKSNYRPHQIGNKLRRIRNEQR